MRNEIQVFEKREVLGQMVCMFGNVETPLFLAKDVAEWIDYNKDSKGQYNVSQMLEMADDDEKVKIYSVLPNVYKEHKPTVATGVANRMFLTEDGLYEVMMQSRLPKAKDFKKEIKLILKQIRKTGGYIPVKQDDDDMSIMTRAMEIMQRTVAQKDELLSLQQPKVDGYDRLMESHNNVDFKDYVKTAKLKVGRNIFMSVLRDEKILMENNTPYQNYVKQGYFKVVLAEKNGHSYAKTLVTKKGIDWLNKKTCEWDLYDSNKN